MEIKIVVDQVSLSSAVADVVSYDEDGDLIPEGTETVGDKVAQIIARDVMKSPEYTSLKERVTRIRTEAIKAAVNPLIAEALTKPIQKTNSYGDPIGEPTTLVELIMAAAKAAWTPGRSGYNDREKSIEQVIGEQVRQHLTRETEKAIKAATEAALKAIGETAGAPVVEAARKALRGK